jgi:hypothetical protein
VTRSGRQTRLPDKYKDYVVYESISDSVIDDVDHEYVHPLSYMTTSDKDNLYYHEILKVEDNAKFIEAMKQEINEHNINGNWVPVLRSSLPGSSCHPICMGYEA